MGQFYSLTFVGDVNGTVVMNTHWYRTEVTGEPTAADLDAVEDEFQANGWPVWRAILSTQYRLKQTIVQGYNEGFERKPYLPQLRDYDASALAVGASAPPIMCAILSFRVTPVNPGPHYRGPGDYELLPVRRGYLAVAGIPDSNFAENGSISSAWRAGTAAQAVATYSRTNRTFATFTEPGIPIRVSGLAKDRVDRGYGLISTAVWRPEASARRSRKLGKGV